MKHVLTITEKTLHVEEYPDKNGRYHGGRFPKTIRIITRKNDVDLSAKGGYSLGSRWVKLGETVAVPQGSIVTFQTNYASKRSPDYEYRAVIVTDDNETSVIKPSEIWEAVEAETDPDKKAKAHNSGAYAIALWCASHFNDVDGEDDNSEIANAVKMLIELTGSKEAAIEAINKYR